MALAGPRLDRPSAVGDEGRPRATSLTIASLVVVALFAAAGWALGSVTTFAGVGTLTGLVAAGMGLQNRTGFVDQFVGNLCLLGAGSVLTLLLVVLSVSGFGLVVVGFTAAMLALALTWADVADASGFRAGLGAAARSFAAFVGWAIGAVLMVFAGVFVWALLTEPTVSRQPVLAMAVFGLAVAGAGVAVSVAVDRLPIVQLAPRSRRDRALRRATRARRLAGQLAKVGAVAMVAVFGLAAILSAASRSGGLPMGRSLATLFGSPFVLAVPVGVGVLALLAAGVASAVRWVAARVETAAADVLPAAAAGLAFLVIVPVAAAGLPRLLLVAPGSVALLLVLGPIALLAVFGGVVLVMKTDLVDERAGGPAIAAGSLLLATVGAGLASLPTPLVLATAAGALVVWDVSTFGLGVTAELGHRPETRRLELFHGVLAVGVGVAAVVVLTGVDLLRRTLVTGGDPMRLAAAVAVGAVLLSIAWLRRSG